MKRILLAAVLLSSCKPPAPALEVRVAAVDCTGEQVAEAAPVLKGRLAGVRGATVEAKDGGLVVALPSLDDEGAMRARLTRRGVLQFVPVVERSGSARMLSRETVAGIAVREDGSVEGPGPDEILAAIKAAAPLAPGEELVTQPPPPESPASWRVWIVDGARALKPEIVRAKAIEDGFGGWAIDLEMSADSGAKFEELTRAIVGRQLAIVLDGEAKTVPTVMEAIGGARARLNVGSEIEAKTLAAVLGHDPLPCAFTVQSISKR